MRLFRHGPHPEGRIALQRLASRDASANGSDPVQVLGSSGSASTL